MLHWIRLAMQDNRTGGNLGGGVEVDETYIGGKVRNMHKDRKAADALPRFRQLLDDDARSNLGKLTGVPPRTVST